MTQHDVAQLVRHHAGHLTLVVRRLDHPAVHEHRSAGQGERVDVARVDDLEGVLELGLLESLGNCGFEPTADPLGRTTGRPRL